jgi:flavin-dependent dehydrogenase
MGISKLSLLASSCLLMSVAGNVLDPKNYPAADIIVTDVAIIGGGSSGTYAAINLRKMGRNVVVVEEKKYLGGHANTYTNHSTGIMVDYGVQAFLNNTVTLNYFSHLGIPVINYPGPNLTFAVADFNNWIGSKVY